MIQQRMVVGIISAARLHTIDELSRRPRRPPCRWTLGKTSNSQEEEFHDVDRFILLAMLFVEQKTTIERSGRSLGNEPAPAQVIHAGHPHTDVIPGTGQHSKRRAWRPETNVSE